MLYRYDSTDLKCESWVYARARAAHFHRLHRKRYCGERDDLDQVAMMAVVALAVTAPNPQQLPEADLIAAVDAALIGEIKSQHKGEPLPQLVNEDRGTTEPAVYARDQPPWTEAEMIALRTFRRQMGALLTQTQQKFLWQRLGLEWTTEQIMEEIIPTDYRRYRAPTEKDIDEIVDKAVALVRDKLPQRVIDGLNGLRRTSEQPVPND